MILGAFSIRCTAMCFSFCLSSISLDNDLDQLVFLQALVFAGEHLFFHHSLLSACMFTASSIYFLQVCFVFIFQLLKYILKPLSSKTVFSKTCLHTYTFPPKNDFEVLIVYILSPRKYSEDHCHCPFIGELFKRKLPKTQTFGGILATFVFQYLNTLENTP